MFACEHRAKALGIEYIVEEIDEVANIAKIKVNGKPYTMSLDPRNYGRLDNGSTIFRLLSSIANANAKRKKECTQ